MTTTHGTFTCVFDCMDGRCQYLVGDWAKKQFGADYADTITIAGLDGVLPKDAAEQERTLAMGKISAVNHGAKNAVVVGHSGCAGFVTDEAGHKQAIEESAQLVKKWGLFESVVGLYVDVDQKSVSEVCRV